MSYGAYKRVQSASATNDARDMEYRLLAQVTGGLIRAQEGKGTLQDRLNAILRNEKVWTVFLEEMNDEANPFPKSLKQGIAKLALFVMKETQLVLNSEEPLDDLININRQIMAGLKPEPATLAG